MADNVADIYDLYTANAGAMSLSDNQIAEIDVFLKKRKSFSLRK